MDAGIWTRWPDRCTVGIHHTDDVELRIGRDRQRDTNETSTEQKTIGLAASLEVSDPCPVSTKSAVALPRRKCPNLRRGDGRTSNFVRWCRAIEKIDRLGGSGRHRYCWSRQSRSHWVMEKDWGEIDR